jgi:superfamily II RNA helicase
MDSQGHVVTVQTPFEGAREAAYLTTVGADPLVSQFTPSYGMVLNLLQTHTLEEAKELVERSFGQYLSTLYLRPQQDAIAHLNAELTQLRSQLEGVDWDLLAQYEKLQERLKEERRLLKILQDQAAEVQASDLPVALSFAIAGTVLSLKGANVPVAQPLPAALVMKVPGAGQFPYLICIGQDNRWYVVTVKDVVGLRGEIPRLSGVDHLTPPPEMPLKPGQMKLGNDETAAIARQIPSVPSPMDEAPEVYEQLQRMESVQQQLEAHPVNRWGNRVTILKRQKRITAVQTELVDRQAKLDQQSQWRWDVFLSLIETLQHFGSLEGLLPTSLGQATAAIRGDNELWLGLALMSGELDVLDAHHLATACAALVTEVSRPDSWTRYELSREVEEALGGLRGIRRLLFQVQRKQQNKLRLKHPQQEFEMPPVWLEYEMVSLVEQWALGAEWAELCSNTSFDEGDVVRILRRTLDFLSQIPHVPHAPNELKTNANRAIRLIDRFPVKEGA